MDLKKLEVQELLNLDDIESEEMLYLKKYGYFPFNVSTWNPSSYFSQKFLDHQLELPSLDYISYIYSYSHIILVWTSHRLHACGYCSAYFLLSCSLEIF